MFLSDHLNGLLIDVGRYSGLGLATFLWKKTGNKYFRLCELYVVSVPTIQFCCCSLKAAITQYVNKRVWLCSNKTLFIKAAHWLDLALGP